MKEQRKFFEASIELCDRCNQVKDVSQFAGTIETTKGERFAICKSCKRERVIQILIKAGNSTGIKFIKKEEV